METKAYTPEVLSVSDVAKRMKAALEAAFPMIWVRGEISNLTFHASGHWYFSLKDQAAAISAVMFKGSAGLVKFRPKVGDEVLVRARGSVYVPRASSQLIVETMEPLGSGLLLRKFEELKNKLQQEGLFDQVHKRAIPSFPKRVAIVTSPTGAALQDILNVLSRRAPGLSLLLLPVVVQGAGTAPSILKALDALDILFATGSVDVAILGRGGGSIEDLWGFNEESLIRRLFSRKGPIISAVGHEIDTTLCDWVCDLRAPTPSAAAELVCADHLMIQNRVSEWSQRLRSALSGRMRDWISQVELLSLKLFNPARDIESKQMRVDELRDRMEALIQRRIDLGTRQLDSAKGRLRQQDPSFVLKLQSAKLGAAQEALRVFSQKALSPFERRFQIATAKLDSISPLKVLSRGYSLVTREKDQKLVSDSDQIVAGETLTLEFRNRQRYQVKAIGPLAQKGVQT